MILDDRDRRVSRVLVTGAGGFVGRATVRALAAAGHQVRADRADVTDPAAVARAVAGVDAVVHLAALVRVRESFDRPEEYERVNTGGTRTVLAAAERAGVRSVVLASTAAVHGVVADRAVREDDPPGPASPYARSKLAGDEAAAEVAARGALGAVSLRTMNVAGPGDTDHTRLIPQVLAPRPTLTVNGDGGARREYTHVDDVADALVRALGACRPGHWRAYLCGSGVLSSVLDVVAAAERVTGRPVATTFREPATREPEALWCDSTRLRTDLGWTAPRSGLETILRDAHAAPRTPRSGP